MVDWSANISKLQTVPSDGFEFSSPASFEVGGHRMGNLSAQQGMEINTPPEAGACSSGISPSHFIGMESDDRPLVESHAHCTGVGVSEETEMEILSSNPRSGGEAVCTKLVGGEREEDRMDSDGGCTVPSSN